MSYTDPLVINVSGTDYTFNRVQIMNGGQGSKYLSVLNTATLSDEVLIRHQSLGRIGKTNREVKRHNFVQTHKEYDSTLGQFDAAKISLSIDFPEGSPNVARNDLNLMINKLIAFLSVSANIDKLLLGES